MSGVGDNVKTMLYVNASWGLGLGMVIDGKLFYGKSGFSGEYGHFPMFDNEVICRCGKRGCLETGASGSAVHRIFLERLGEGRISMLSDRFKNGEEITLEDILAAVLKEDVLAIEIMESVGHTLGKALAGLIRQERDQQIFAPDGEQGYRNQVFETRRKRRRGGRLPAGPRQVAAPAVAARPAATEPTNPIES